MKIALLVKQVPATDKVKINRETGTMIRENLESELNPLDMYAVEEAVRIKERYQDTEVIAFSMGPPFAKEALKDAISMGADKGYLISDRRFGGADTWATAYTLAWTLRKFGNFDIIFTGERATDGETGQVGPSVAAQLGIPILSYVSKIIEIERDTITVERSIEGGKEIVSSTLPVVISVVKEINEPRIPNLSGKIKAKKANIPILTAEDLKVDFDKIGLMGSPTRVVNVYYPKMTRTGKIIKVQDPKKCIEELVSFLREKGVM